MNETTNPNHYNQYSIQPIEYIIANNLTYIEGNIIKYVSRYKLKNGIDDLKKAQVYLQWLIDLTENKEIKLEKQVKEKIPLPITLKEYQDYLISKRNNKNGL